MKPRPLAAALTLCLTAAVAAAQTAPTTRPTTGVGKFPHVEVDLARKEIRVDCESLNPQMPIEFFCVLSGTSEHESVLRTAARPMHLHTALLMLGAKPGEPAKYNEAEKRRIPPRGQALDLQVEATREGKAVREPAAAWMREVNTKKPPESFTWVFAGSRTMPDGTYAADVTGQVVSVVNFDYSMIDVPRVASNANETLEWEYNPDRVPKKGTKVTLVIRLANPPAATEPSR
jgi:hypothetical protein